jgi:hypothetical protein
MQRALRNVFRLVIAAIAGSARADDRPHRRPGLWEVIRTAVDATNPARTTQICIDRETEITLRDIDVSLARSIGSSAEIQASQSQVSADAICQLRGSRTSTHTVIRFSGDTACHQVSTTGSIRRCSAGSRSPSRWKGNRLVRAPLICALVT